MTNLTEQQECKVWDDMTELAKSADKKIRQLAKEVGADYDYVRGVFDQVLDADFVNEMELAEQLSKYARAGSQVKEVLVDEDPQTLL